MVVSVRSDNSSTDQTSKSTAGRNVAWTEHEVGLAVLSFDVRDEGETYKFAAERILRPPKTLSPTQRIVAGLAAYGHRNSEIAQELGISVRTVANHMAAALRKTGAASRFELAHKLSRRA